MYVTPRFTLANLLAIVMVFGVGASLAISLTQSIRRSRLATCQANLRVLWQAQFSFSEPRLSRCCGPMRTDVGADYWLKLQRGTRPVVDSHERFFCPLGGESVVEGRTSYRGPSLNVNKLEDGDFIAADKEGNHGPGRGGTVLTKAGDCFEAPAADPAWIRARTTTRE